MSHYGRRLLGVLVGCAVTLTVLTMLFDDVQPAVVIPVVTAACALGWYLVDHDDAFQHVAWEPWEITGRRRSPRQVGVGLGRLTSAIDLATSGSSDGRRLQRVLHELTATALARRPELAHQPRDGLVLSQQALLPDELVQYLVADPPPRLGLDAIDRLIRRIEDL